MLSNVYYWLPWCDLKCIRSRDGDAVIINNGIHICVQYSSTLIKEEKTSTHKTTSPPGRVARALLLPNRVNLNIPRLNNRCIVQYVTIYSTHHNGSKSAVTMERLQPLLRLLGQDRKQSLIALHGSRGQCSPYLLFDWYAVIRLINTCSIFLMICDTSRCLALRCDKRESIQ